MAKSKKPASVPLDANKHVTDKRSNIPLTVRQQIPSTHARDSCMGRIDGRNAFAGTRPGVSRCGIGLCSEHHAAVS